MASIWKGAINFGLVNVPVELRTAVRADHISFKMLNADDNAPVKYQRVASSTGEEVAWDDIVKGYEYSKGKYIVLTDDDFKKAALATSSTIDICDFVPENEIDPRYFETPYFVVPTKGGEKAYALLREAMSETKSVAVGKIIMRQKQHLAGLHVVGDAIVMEIMRFANEVLEPQGFVFPPSSAVKSAERTMAIQLVNSLASKFEPEKYTDEYRANLMRIIDAKAKGTKVKLDMPVRNDDDGKVVDLMSRLKASLDRADRKGGSKVAKKSSTTGRSASASSSKTSKASTSKTAKSAPKKTATPSARRSARPQLRRA